jgi:YHS domain-containing protein
MPRLIRCFIWCALALLSGCGSHTTTVKNITGQQVMLMGHDPVAYFTQQQSVRGNPVFQSTTAGRTYYFLNAKNKQVFDAAPAQYEPQYAGFCAQGMAQGLKLGSDPSEWRIVDGKLYIFAHGLARAGWDLNPALHAANGQRMWPQAQDAGWRSQSLYRMVVRTADYQSDARLRKLLWEKDANHPAINDDMGSAWQQLTAPHPSWRALQGHGTRAKLGMVGDDPCPVACIGLVSKAFGPN